MLDRRNGLALIISDYFNPVHEVNALENHVIFIFKYLISESLQVISNGKVQQQMLIYVSFMNWRQFQSSGITGIKENVKFQFLFQVSTSQVA